MSLSQTDFNKTIGRVNNINAVKCVINSWPTKYLASSTIDLMAVYYRVNRDDGAQDSSIAWALKLFGYGCRTVLYVGLLLISHPLALIRTIRVSLAIKKAAAAEEAAEEAVAIQGGPGSEPSLNMLLVNSFGVELGKNTATWELLKSVEPKSNKIVNLVKAFKPTDGSISNLDGSDLGKLLSDLEPNQMTGLIEAATPFLAGDHSITKANVNALLGKLNDQELLDVTKNALKFAKPLLPAQYQPIADTLLGDDNLDQTLNLIKTTLEVLDERKDNIDLAALYLDITSDAPEDKAKAVVPAIGLLNALLIDSGGITTDTLKLAKPFTDLLPANYKSIADALLGDDNLDQTLNLIEITVKVVNERKDNIDLAGLYLNITSPATSEDEAKAVVPAIRLLNALLIAPNFKDELSKVLNNEKLYEAAKGLINSKEPANTPKSSVGTVEKDSVTEGPSIGGGGASVEGSSSAAEKDLIKAAIVGDKAITGDLLTALGEATKPLVAKLDAKALGFDEQLLQFGQAVLNFITPLPAASSKEAAVEGRNPDENDEGSSLSTEDREAEGTSSGGSGLPSPTKQKGLSAAEADLITKSLPIAREILNNEGFTTSAADLLTKEAMVDIISDKFTDYKSLVTNEDVKDTKLVTAALGIAHDALQTIDDARIKALLESFIPPQDPIVPTNEKGKEKEDIAEAEKSQYERIVESASPVIAQVLAPNNPISSWIRDAAQDGRVQKVVKEKFNIPQQYQPLLTGLVNDDDLIVKTLELYQNINTIFNSENPGTNKQLNSLITQLLDGKKTVLELIEDNLVTLATVLDMPEIKDFVGVLVKNPSVVEFALSKVDNEKAKALLLSLAKEPELVAGTVDTVNNPTKKPTFVANAVDITNVLLENLTEKQVMVLANVALNSDEIFKNNETILKFIDGNLETLTKVLDMPGVKEFIVVTAKNPSVMEFALNKVENDKTKMLIKSIADAKEGESITKGLVDFVHTVFKELLPQSQSNKANTTNESPQKDIIIVLSGLFKMIDLDLSKAAKGNPNVLPIAKTKSRMIIPKNMIEPSSRLIKEISKKDESKVILTSLITDLSKISYVKTTYLDPITRDLDKLITDESVGQVLISLDQILQSITTEDLETIVDEFNSDEMQVYLFNKDPNVKPDIPLNLGKKFLPIFAKVIGNDEAVEALEKILSNNVTEDFVKKKLKKQPDLLANYRWIKENFRGILALIKSTSSLKDFHELTNLLTEWKNERDKFKTSDNIDYIVSKLPKTVDNKPKIINPEPYLADIAGQVKAIKEINGAASAADKLAELIIKKSKTKNHDLSEEVLNWAGARIEAKENIGGRDVYYIKKVMKIFINSKLIAQAVGENNKPMAQLIRTNPYIEKLPIKMVASKEQGKPDNLPQIVKDTSDLFCQLFTDDQISYLDEAIEALLHIDTLPNRNDDSVESDYDSSVKVARKLERAVFGIASSVLNTSARLAGLKDLIKLILSNIEVKANKVKDPQTRKGNTKKSSNRQKLIARNNEIKNAKLIAQDNKIKDKLRKALELLKGLHELKEILPIAEHLLKVMNKKQEITDEKELFAKAKAEGDKGKADALEANIKVLEEDFSRILPSLTSEIKKVLSNNTFMDEVTVKGIDIADLIQEMFRDPEAIKTIENWRFSVDELVGMALTNKTKVHSIIESVINLLDNNKSGVIALTGIAGGAALRFGREAASSWYYGRLPPDIFETILALPRLPTPTGAANLYEMTENYLDPNVNSSTLKFRPMIEHGTYNYVKFEKDLILDKLIIDKFKHNSYLSFTGASLKKLTITNCQVSRLDMGHALISTFNYFTDRYTTVESLIISDSTLKECRFENATTPVLKLKNVTLDVQTFIELLKVADRIANKSNVSFIKIKIQGSFDDVSLKLEEIERLMINNAVIFKQFKYSYDTSQGESINSKSFSTMLDDYKDDSSIKSLALLLADKARNMANYSNPRDSYFMYFLGSLSNTLTDFSSNNSNLSKIIISSIQDFIGEITIKPTFFSFWRSYTGLANIYMSGLTATGYQCLNTTLKEFLKEKLATKAIESKKNDKDLQSPST